MCASHFKSTPIYFPLNSMLLLLTIFIQIQLAVIAAVFYKHTARDRSARLYDDNAAHIIIENIYLICVFLLVGRSCAGNNSEFELFREKNGTMNSAHSTEFVVQYVRIFFNKKHTIPYSNNNLCHIVVIMYYLRASWNFVRYIYFTMLSCMVKYCFGCINMIQFSSNASVTSVPNNHHSGTSTKIIR